MLDIALRLSPPEGVERILLGLSGLDRRIILVLRRCTAGAPEQLTRNELAVALCREALSFRRRVFFFLVDLWSTISILG